MPVLRDCDRMSIAEVEGGIKNYAVAAKDVNLAIEDMTVGTFTITNGGVFGSLLSTPILNPPQTAILGMHKNSRASDGCEWRGCDQTDDVPCALI